MESTVAERGTEAETTAGYKIPFPDPITRDLDLQVRTWADLLQQRIRFMNRAVDPDTGYVRDATAFKLAEGPLREMEGEVNRMVAKLIREHPMADWLEDAKTQGARVGTILTTIKHPHRFPGQRCGHVDPKTGRLDPHYTLPVFEEGEPCPSITKPKDGGDPEPCDSTMGPPRAGTGCRALWHMVGLYPVGNGDGKARLATYRKGVQGSHNRAAKTALLMPQGITQQFYMQGSRYADVYYEEKARLREKWPDRADGWSETTARVIAGKAWLGDLLLEWKRRVPLEG